MSELDLTADELELILKRRKAEARKAATTYTPRPISDIPSDEKLRRFDKIYAFAMRVWDDCVRDGYHDEDDKHYAYEMVMELLAANEDRESAMHFWGVFNALVR